MVGCHALSFLFALIETDNPSVVALRSAVGLRCADISRWRTEFATRVLGNLTLY